LVTPTVSPAGASDDESPPDALITMSATTTAITTTTAPPINHPLRDTRELLGVLVRSPRVAAAE
jgi:hypothetical protein